ncbi:MAG: amino acid adenylation domain-containing protein, partial [Opitutaceae bacterium]
LLHDFFERSVRRSPESVAIEVPPGPGHPIRARVTFAELARQADALAGELRPWIVRESVVAIFLPRNSALLYAAQLAVLKAGAGYTCIDPTFPDERIRHVLEDSDAAGVLTDHAGRARIAQAMPNAGQPIVEADAALQQSSTRAQPAVAPAWLDSSAVAYVIYTSGTSGQPKGVVIEHRSIVNLVAGDLAEFKLSSSDRVGQSSSAAYDSSVEETWLAFAAGATLVVMDDATSRLGPDLVPWLRREGITVFCPPPTLLRATGCEHPETALPDLKLLYVGGEPLPRDVADRWSRGRRLVNGYGPTECTVTSLRGDILENAPITIGQPVPGLFGCVLDEQMIEVTDGRGGELCLGGLGLARGYWKRPALTAEKFFIHPSFGRLYRTGDLVNRDNWGNYHYHGRLDSQVKIRGFRIELEEIESRLAACAGVRAAACRVQDESTHPTLVAFIVPENPAAPPSPATLKSALETNLPVYMVPARFGMLDALPITVGGKLNRAALPRLVDVDRRAKGAPVPPSNAMEIALESAFREVLRLPDPVSIHDDFFVDLGGDSLSAAVLVTELRDNDATTWVTVRDIYEARSVAELAKRAPKPGTDEPTAPTSNESPRRTWPLMVTFAQTLWLLAILVIGSWFAYVNVFEFVPRLFGAIGLVRFILVAPLLGLAALGVYASLSVFLAVAVKRALIGRYHPLRGPVWGGFFLRNWIVQQAVRLVPWRSFEGTTFQLMALRALGVRIGQRVHIHRGVNLLQGGWDLLEIGDDVTLSQDAALRIVELDDRDIVIAPVRLGAGSTLDIRATVGGHTVLEPGAFLTALSSLPPGGRLPQGERWDGIPAQPAGRSPVVQPISKPGGRLPSLAHGGATILARGGIILLLALPSEALVLIALWLQGIAPNDVGSWLSQATSRTIPWITGLVIVTAAVPLTLLLEAGLVRLLGRVAEGTMDRWSLAYVRISLKTGMVESAGRWLSGTFFWPAWLRCAGMKIGKGCEISTIIDVVPEHIEIGESSFLADGIYLGGPRIHQGVVTVTRTRLGRNTFLGNHVVVAAGQQLPDDILLGVSTVADDKIIRSGTSWFGLPPFELPRRETVELDRRLTHEPSWIRVANRLFWELLRFTLPGVPLYVFVVWFQSVAIASAKSGPFVLAVALPWLSLCALGSLCGLVLALKWILLGRVRPAQHALWSCWCSRWDFLYVAWGEFAAPTLAHLEGTLLLSWYLRAMGMKLGKRVVLGSGFAHVVDPDMIQIEDNATVNAMFQAHTFEDRVLKIDHVHVRAGATLGHGTVPLYGAEIGERAQVAAHSVIMKQERLLPGKRYEGAPTQRSRNLDAISGKTGDAPL